MKKANRTKVLVLVLAMVLALAVSAPALAAGGVEYSEGLKTIVFTPGSVYSESDLFDGFKNVMPGDTLYQTISITNNAGTESTIYLHILGENMDDPRTPGFLSKMTMTVTQNGSEIFSNSPDAGLAEPVSLGKFAPHETKTLDLILTVKPLMGNDFQSAIGRVDWQFSVEQWDPPVPPPTPTPTPTPTPVTPIKPPRSGEQGLIWAALPLLAVVALGAVLAMKKHSQGK